MTFFSTERLLIRWRDIKQEAGKERGNGAVTYEHLLSEAGFRFIDKLPNVSSLLKN